MAADVLIEKVNAMGLEKAFRDSQVANNKDMQSFKPLFNPASLATSISQRDNYIPPALLEMLLSDEEFDNTMLKTVDIHITPEEKDPSTNKKITYGKALKSLIEKTKDLPEEDRIGKMRALRLEVEQGLPSKSKQESFPSRTYRERRSAARRKYRD
jgi:hypothetical protein